MERREFLRKSVVASAVLVVTPSALLMEGCSVDVKALLNTVINAAEAVLKVAQPNAPWLQPLENAILALQQAEQSWTGGSPVQVIISALNTVEAVLAVIPVTAVYSPLIAILVAGIEAVLAAVVPSPVAVTAVNNPYRGKAKLKGRSMVHPTHQGAFKAQWNETAVSVGCPYMKI